MTSPSAPGRLGGRGGCIPHGHPNARFSLVGFDQITGLGTLGGEYSEAYDAWFDGSVVVGRATNSTNAFHAFRWTAGGGMQDLGTLGATIYSDAVGVSADGSVVAGLQVSCSPLPAVQRSACIGTLGGLFSAALDVSSDGGTIVGYSEDANRNARAFRWTPRRE